MKLKEIINKLDKSSIKAGEGNSEGLYPLFTCSPIVSKYLDSYMFDKEALVLSTGGNFAIHYINGKFNYSTDCYAFNTYDYNLKYLYYYLSSKSNDINKMFRGAGLKHLNKNEFLLFEIKETDKEKQSNIVAILDKVEFLIKLRKKEINNYDFLIKSQFVEMFGCKQEGFKCDTIQFSKCVLSMLKGPFGSDIKKSLYVPKSDNTYKVYIQVNAIQKNEQLGDYYISKDYFDDKMYKYEVKPLDYIVTCDGTLGKLLRLDDNMEKGIISSSLLKITLNEKISYKYFEEVWKQYILSELSRDIRNACLNHLPSAKVIGSLYIPFPPKELQDRYTKIVEQIDKQKFVSENISQMVYETSKSWYNLIIKFSGS